MRQYYPVISVAAALLLLLLPIVILLGSSGSSDPSESADRSTEVSKDEYERLRQQLSLANSKLRALENDAGKASKPTEATDTRKPVAGEVMNPAGQSPAGRFPRQQHASAGEELQRIEDRIDALNKQLAQLVAAKSTPVDSPKPSAEDPDRENADSDAPELAKRPPAESELTPPARKDARAASPEMTADESTAKPEPESSKVLTADELSKVAKTNLRDRMATEVDPAEIDEEPVERVEEIFLRRPLDGMTVNRVEQLYAQTTAPGWPVVLVRSSFDDEEWWAQPISGRRGAQITARVHFGNDTTPRGTAFSMVILLLDGYEEAVRFRTARRFKEIPKGIRRSQQFMFVLK